jgi:teichuronic acid biosynthesis glycosyltransferase TuaC
MKIAMLTTSFPAYEGHLQTPFLRALAKALSKDHKVKVICPYYGLGSKKKETIGNMEIDRFQYAPLRFQKLTEGGGIPSTLKHSSKWELPFHILAFLSFLFVFMLKSLKSCRDCDVIHAQWAFSGLIALPLKKIYKKPLIITTRGEAVNMAMKNKISKIMLRYVFRNADFITPNNHAHVGVTKELGISEEKILAVPNGIDVEMFKPRDRDGSRDKLGLSKDKLIVLFVGWLIERKGVNYLLEAASEIKKNNPNALFIILGTGIMEEELKAYSKKLNLDESVRFVGSKPSHEIPTWFNASNVFVMPSLSEGRPNTVAEAASSGLPVVATAVQGTPELIQEGKSGFLVPSKDSKILYERIKILLEDEKMREKFGKKGREHILENCYTWDKCAVDYIDVYDRTLRKVLTI